MLLSSREMQIKAAAYNFSWRVEQNSNIKALQTYSLNASETFSNYHEKKYSNVDIKWIKFGSQHRSKDKSKHITYWLKKKNAFENPNLPGKKPNWQYWFKMVKWIWDRRSRILLFYICYIIHKQTEFIIFYFMRLIAICRGFWSKDIVRDFHFQPIIKLGMVEWMIMITILCRVKCAFCRADMKANAKR